MNLNLEWKLFLLNTFCQSIFFMYTLIAFYIGFTITLPYIYSSDPGILWNHRLLVIILLCNVVGNYLCIRYKARHSMFSQHGDTSSSKEQELYYRYGDQSSFNNNNLNGLTGPQRTAGPSVAGWVECRSCDILAPPRSKHCGLCKACILKRDHHCFFAGCCIGFHNQRYFIIFCLYCTLGALYSSFATLTYIKSHYAGVQDWGTVAYLLPVLLYFWFVGAASGSTVLMVIYLYWNVFTAAVCAFFFGLQIFLVLRGQTKYELKKNVFHYRSNLRVNLKSVFGSGLVGFLSFLIPSPCLGYFGDGKMWDELNCKFA